MTPFAKNPVRKIKLLTLLLLLVLGATGCGRYFQPAAAIVDGKVISLAEVDRRVGPQGAKGQPSSPAQKLEGERRELAQMIQDRIVQSEGEKEHIKVAAAEVDGRYQRIRSQFRTEDEFRNALQQQGINPSSVKDRIRLRLIVEAIQKRISSQIKITDAEVKGVYGDGSTFEEANVRHILFSAQRPPEFPVALKKAQAALARIRKGEDFAKLAKQLSQDPGSKGQGGALGAITRGRTVPEFEKAVFSMKAGQISQPVRTQFGYHIIQTLSISKKTFAQAAPEIRTKLQQQQAKKAFNDFLSSRIKRADIRVNPRLGRFDPRTLSVVDQKFYTPARPQREPEGIPGLQPGGQPIQIQPQPGGPPGQPPQDQPPQP
ncbi:MAG: hypothetical protein NVSMB57_12300 [Actinomycetota bacterium]